jgi:N-methylhydantoinase A
LSAAAGLAARLGLERVLSFDMGGTTAKAGAILGGTPETVAEFEAAGRTHSGRYVRGSGYPVRFPFLDLAEVSAGGGTIAHLDRGGALRVGPISAGADPGPVCYGRGGADPTVTDANLILGRLNPIHLLGGAMPIDRTAAERAIAVLAARVALDPLELASGVVRLIDAEMARALRMVSIERGHDPRRFAMIAFGGGGPLHACALAAALGVRRVIVPQGPGLFSAAGLLTSPLKVSLVRPVLGGITVAGPGQLAELFVSMAAEAGADLRRQAADAAAIRSVSTLDMRYAGQSFELSVPVTPTAEAWLDDAFAAFHARHRAVYGYASPNHEVEIVAARLAATAPAEVEVGMAPLASPSSALPAPTNHRPVFFDQAGGFTVTPVYWRDDLPASTELTGPAVIEQYDATTLLHPGWQLAVDVDGNLRLDAASAPAD